MINTRFERTANGQILAMCHCHWHHKNDFRFMVQGTEVEVRSRLQSEYRDHVLAMVDTLIAYANTTNTHFGIMAGRSLNRVASMHQTCHITISKELTEINLFASLPKGNGFFDGFKVLLSITETANQFLTDRASLWVRGPVETLDGQFHKPWKNEAHNGANNQSLSKAA